MEASEILGCNMNTARPTKTTTSAVNDETVFSTCDMPAGTVNLLSGHLDELETHISTHMEINAISFQNENEDIYYNMRSSSTDNMKRMIPFKKNKRKSLSLILDFVESKTVWHPIELSNSGGKAY